MFRLTNPTVRQIFPYRVFPLLGTKILPPKKTTKPAFFNKNNKSVTSYQSDKQHNNNNLKE